MLTLSLGEHWICVSCRAEILVLTPSNVTDGFNPRCSCGNVMKKPYHAPKLEMVTGEKAARFFGEQIEQLSVTTRPLCVGTKEIS
jgi:hypothetical protein